MHPPNPKPGSETVLAEERVASGRDDGAPAAGAARLGPRPGRAPFFVLGLFTVAVAAGWGWQVERTRQLRRELAARLGPAAAAVDGAGARSAMHAAVRLAGRTQAVESTAEQLRAELSWRRARAEAWRRAQAEAPGEVVAEDDWLDLRRKPAAQWRDRGAEEPVGAVETLLWAAAGGDLERMSELLLLNGAARDRAEAVWARLTPAARSEFGEPKSLVAALTAVSVPLGPAKVLNVAPEPGRDDSPVQVAVVQVAEEDGLTRTLALRLSQIESAGGGGAEWRVMVPEAAIVGFEAMLWAELPSQSGGP